MSKIFHFCRLFPQITNWNGGLHCATTVKSAKAIQCSITKRPLRLIRFSSDIPREDTPISQYPVPDMTTLDPNVQERFREVEKKTGFLPNVFKVLAYRPAELGAFLGYYDVLMDKNYGKLTPAEKELIVVATSAKNNCQYCVVAHSAVHRIFSKNPYLADQVAINWESANLSQRERAVLEFALDVMDCEVITQQHYDDLAQQGLDKEDAWDIGAIAALFALSNRMAFTTGMKPNEEFHLLGRIPRDKTK